MDISDHPGGVHTRYYPKRRSSIFLPRWVSSTSSPRPPTPKSPNMMRLPRMLSTTAAVCIILQMLAATPPCRPTRRPPGRRL
ncbi:hypothetical protein BJX76DRAFT_325415, partial [Aspergillus varians]